MVLHKTDSDRTGRDGNGVLTEGEYVLDVSRERDF